VIGIGICSDLLRMPKNLKFVKPLILKNNFLVSPSQKTYKKSSWIAETGFLLPISN
jgi:hypothetical protein